MNDEELNDETFEIEYHHHQYTRHFRRMKEWEHQKEEYRKDKMRTKIATILGVLLLVTIFIIIAVEHVFY